MKAATVRKSAPASAHDFAARRVNRDPSLRNYRYVLVDDPLLQGPYRFAVPERQEDRATLEKHFAWLADAPVAQILQRAIDVELEFVANLQPCIEAYKRQAEGLFQDPRFESDRESLLEIATRAGAAAVALKEHRLSDAGGYAWEARTALSVFFIECAQRRLAPLVHTGMSVVDWRRKGLDTAHGGTATQRGQRYAEMQLFINNWYSRHKGRWSYRQARAKAADHFGCCEATIRKHCHNPARANTR